MRFLIRKAVSPGSERNPHEEFLLKNTQVNLETFSHFIRVVSLPFLHNITEQHYFNENWKKEKKPLWHVESLI